MVNVNIYVKIFLRQEISQITGKMGGRNFHK